MFNLFFLKNTNRKGFMITLFRLFHTMFYCLQEDESYPELEKFIDDQVFKWREFVFKMSLKIFYVPKNHACYEIVLQRLLLGPTRWFRTNSKETKHHTLREYSTLGNRKDVVFDLLANEIIRQYLRHISDGGTIEGIDGKNLFFFFFLKKIKVIHLTIFF